MVFRVVLDKGSVKRRKKRPPGYYSYLKDGGEGGPSAEALVSGHAGPAVPSSVGAEDVDLTGYVPTAGTPQTWGSPQDATDFVSDARPAGAFLGALDGGARTAGQPEGFPGADSEASCLPPVKDSCGSALRGDQYY